MTAALEIRDLTLILGQTQILHGISLRAEPGRITALVGESGSGKSMTLLAALRLAPAHAQIGGAVSLDGEDLLQASEARMQKVRGARVGMVFQEVMTALNPVRTIGAQVAEVVQVHLNVDARAAAAAARAALDRVGLSEIDSSRYPHQLSGGQRQRVAIAIAIVLKPAVLLADEPTTALDVTTQAQVLDLLRTLVREDGMALILVTHDLALVSHYADDVVIMRDGAVVETGSGALGSLNHEYSRALLSAATAAPRRSGGAVSDETLLEVRNVSVTYRAAHSQRRSALMDVSFSVRRGETLGIVGESGSGKSTLARAVLGLQPLDAGGVSIGGRTFAHARGADLKALRRLVQIVFQDPAGSFDPRQTIERVVAEPLFLAENPIPRVEQREMVERVLQEVGLPAAAADRYPHQFSGGQRQRIAIARALISEPSLIVLDEAVSALDVQVRAQILSLLTEISARRGVSYLFISHDIEIVRGMTDRVVVLNKGRIVEQGLTERVFSTPQHDYTKSLLAASPRLQSVG